jgi:molecular chaperone GrpE
VIGGSGSGGETADRFPPEAGREVGAPPEIGSVERERDDYRDALQRLQADFENYKKRVAKQSEEMRARAAESLVLQLLPVLDTADLALSHGAGEDVKQLSAALFAVLEKEGLEKIDNAGEPFDPTLHDAVAHDPGEGDSGQEVAEVMRAGYRWRGRVLRPAMVRVRG